MDSWMLYGAYGFTGTLIAEEAVRRGHRPILAGRNQARLAGLSEKLGLKHLVLPLEDEEALNRSVADFDLVLHTAGPYTATFEPMINACLAGKTHYLDICGELYVIPKILAYDDLAKAAGITIIPGVGFDVLPSDCLVRYVSEKLPGADELELALSGIGRPSAGTVKTSLDIVSRGGVVRRDGRLKAFKFGRGAKTIRFSHGKTRTVLPVPWADLATAFRTTGIPNITVYLALSPSQIRLIRWTGSMTQAVMSTGLVRKMINRSAGLMARGPDESLRETGRSYLWARCADRQGNSAEAWLETTESYRFTAEAAVRSVQKTLEADLRGAFTPAEAFGSDFILAFDNTHRFDTLPS